MSFNIITSIALISGTGFLLGQFFTKQIPIRVFILISTFTSIFFILLFEDNTFISVSILIIYVNALAIIFLFTLMVFIKLEEVSKNITLFETLISILFIFSFCYSIPLYIQEKIKIKEIKNTLFYSNPFELNFNNFWDMYTFIDQFYSSLWYLIAMCGLLLLISIICVVGLSSYSPNSLVHTKYDFKRN